MLINVIKNTIIQINCFVKLENYLLENCFTGRRFSQGNTLTYLLFNIDFQKMLNFQTGYYFSKSFHILAVTYDINIVGRSKRDIQKSFKVLCADTAEMGLKC